LSSDTGKAPENKLSEQRRIADCDRSFTKCKWTLSGFQDDLNHGTGRFPAPDHECCLGSG
jgi:hypothetical protein